MTDKKPTKLTRKLGLPSVLFYGLGNILGAGIYVLVGKVAGVAGYGAPLAFVVASVIAALTALSYMELSSRYPVSGSVSAYMHHAYRSKFLSLSIGLMMIAGGIVSAAVLARGFGGYAAELIHIPQWILTVGVIIILSAIVMRGIGESVGLAVIFTIVEIAGLLLVIYAGRYELTHAATHLTQTFTIDPKFGIAGIIGGAFLAFYAFIGFEDMVNVAEETKHPTRTIPLAIIGSLVIATFLYIATITVAIHAIPIDQLAESSAPLTLVATRLLPSMAIFVTVIGISAAINGIIAHLIMGSRMLYALARRGWLTGQLAEVSDTSHTPVAATLVMMGAVITASLILPLVALARLTSMLLLIIFCSVNLALIVIKRRTRSKRGVMSVPIWVPYAGLFTSLMLILAQIVT